MAQKLNSTIKKSMKLFYESKFEDAVLLLKKYIRNRPKDVQALNILGQSSIKQEKYAEAAEFLAQSVALFNDNHILGILGYAYEKSEEYNLAIETYQKAYNGDNNQKHLLDAIGRTLAKQGRNYEAVKYLLDAAEHIEDVSLYNNLAYTSAALGLFDLALEYYNKVFELDPTHKDAHGCLIFNSHKHPSCSYESLQKLTIEHYELFCKPEIAHLICNPKAKLDSTKTTLKLGFISGDFSRHPVGGFMLNLLSKMNLDKFKVNLYHTKEKTDAITDQFKALDLNYNHVYEDGYQALCDKIINDEIDILFDLSGFTKGSRMNIFGKRIAPVQVSYLGYFGTCGIPNMDFIITDGHLVREGEEQYFTERVYRMPHNIINASALDLIEVSEELPYDRNGYITFGSMNNLHKISPDILSVWSEILKKVDNSKIIFNALALNSKYTKEYLADLLRQFDIDSSRVEVRSDQDREEFLSTYNDIDIALDPFYYGGGTTTLESLLMGVPMIARDGNTWMSRSAASFLRTVGLDEFIADDIDGIIDIGVNIEQKVDRLRELRRKLPSMVHNSPLNLDSFTKDFEQAILDIWQIKCSEQL